MLNFNKILIVIFIKIFDISMLGKDFYEFNKIFIVLS